jgi:cytochrome c oxidase subunit 2
MAIIYFFTFFALASFSVIAGPHAWQMGFQEAASPVMERIEHLHSVLLYIITAIAVFVIGLIGYVMVRFRASRNAIPSKTAHYTLLEIFWTAIPTLIVIIMLVPSLKTLYYMERSPETSVTVKVIGHQWYWSYDYPSNSVSFDSYIIEDKNLKPGQLRLLEVDRPIVLPVNTMVKILLTSADVLHSWAIPPLGLKTDCVPGRLNETWVKITKEGRYYGQCSELCGTRHGFMPIVIDAVSPQAYQEWLNKNKNS